ncbi:hypothetical protein RA28_00920 [Ruegeria sp. ANG-S4]|uniref:hypothetical protein n=1 Tax=Ruegeria sp. ANG-S4 TaxID=1577904 RepID=UPI0005806BAB|nr:hypothetical protein [Ruegeria sp. ANG-S4]KIC46399.1 hypothetical protein RA28_00920 [Ruegeria sp. ANG-S4]
MGDLLSFGFDVRSDARIFQLAFSYAESWVRDGRPLSLCPALTQFLSEPAMDPGVPRRFIEPVCVTSTVMNKKFYHAASQISRPGLGKGKQMTADTLSPTGFRNPYVFNQRPRGAPIGQSGKDRELQTPDNDIIQRCHKHVAIGIALNLFEGGKIGAGVLWQSAFAATALFIIPKHMNDASDVRSFRLSHCYGV